jgi:hypothetical protein
VHDDFVAALTEQARATSTTFANGPSDEDALVPPVNNALQLERVTGFLDRVPTTRRSRPVAAGRATAASSSSRPWSPACTRTTSWCRTRCSAR